MSEARKAAGSAATVEEDPNAAVVCNSPPCFMHELDPSYLGYLPREEVRTLVAALLAAEWGDAGSDGARARAALRRHLEALGGRPDSEPDAAIEPLRRGPDRLVPMIRDALPRIQSGALRRDLGEALDALGQGAPHRGGTRHGS